MRLPDRSRRLLIGACAAGTFAMMATGAGTALADESFPNRPIRIIVGYAPGGTTDIIARTIAPKMSAHLGQSVVIENRPDAGGNLGAELVARAEPDGYTLQMGTAGNMTVNPSIYANMKFDPNRDFEPISLVAAVANIMVVNPSVPAKTVAEFIAWAKERPDKVFFASSGIGNTPHMTGELFNLTTGLSLVHVPYKGSGPALTELIGGQSAHVMFDNMPSAIGHVRSGALRALATTGATRSAASPDLPTLQEAGLKDFDVRAWFGLFAPKGTPRPIIEKLHAATLAALEDPAIRKSLDSQGAEVVGNTPEEFGRIVASEGKRWAEVVKAAKIEMR
jgi:tripartite-type tricarboxylate transporter receptor subunit TctC